MSSVRPIPAGAASVTAHLTVSDAAAAIEFYKKAFGAVEVARMPIPGSGKLLHAEINIRGTAIMLCDELPMMEYWQSPATLKGTTVALHLWCEDVDAAFKQAIAAGATISMPLIDMFWGDRYGKLRDPFGHEWSLATHQRDLTPEEIAQGAADFFRMIGM
jgi:PhnB protein